MANASLPQARTPIGWAQINGVRTPVEIDIEWMRALYNLVARVGGLTVGEVNAALEALALSPMSPEFDQAAPLSQLTIAPVHVSMPIPETPDASLQALEAEVHALRVQINDIRQGYQV